ncbi:DNA-(apurinic or apyrimidinic site) lyase [Rhodanobacter sp. Root179]|uniref:DNA-formamidopyrimidine glycosylase family protein n=1 Tax=Rhodanobacter sp. Root179 TaxID=1736482 RepID=UPI0006F4E641|nr:DNA-formamidopyrimidine glycosylase family protein [Rhodanobacter sp. Root179]KRB52281.1 endonuclease [Rhodanobacter sp. Root179]
MPEGPSIVILREQSAAFAGRTIRRATGNAKIDLQRLPGRRVLALRSFGKQFLVELSGELNVRVHLLMFGSYRIDEERDIAPRLGLGFDEGELNFYNCSVRLLEGRLDELYDWRGDVMSEHWDPKLARAKLRAMPHTLVCDALLDQTVFAGVGNIIKNEVLFRIRVHPLSTIGALSPYKLAQLVEQARVYAFEFLAWKKAFVLARHWLVHNRGRCPRHDIPLQRAYLGKTHRRSFFCLRCQKLYTDD